MMDSAADSSASGRPSLGHAVAYGAQLVQRVLQDQLVEEQVGGVLEAQRRVFAAHQEPEQDPPGLGAAGLDLGVRTAPRLAPYCFSTAAASERRTRPG
jgi:hypothetical protein